MMPWMGWCAEGKSKSGGVRTPRVVANDPMVHTKQRQPSDMQTHARVAERDTLTPRESGLLLVCP